MSQLLSIVQLVSGILLVILILPQSKGKGLGRSTNTGFTRRGLERLVFRSTFYLAAIFILSSLLRLVL